MEFVQGQAMIDVIVPVLSRPENAWPLVESLTLSEADAVVTFVCTGGDKPQIRACQETGARVLIVKWPAGPGDYARKINAGFNDTSGEYVLNGADDIEFARKWDTIALGMMRGRVRGLGVRQLLPSRLQGWRRRILHARRITVLRRHR